MAEEHNDAAFIEYVVKQLVEKPDAVQVERTVDEMGVLIQLTVDQSDMGRVIGKEGRTAKALRTLLRVMGAKNNARVNLKIMEPGGGEVAMGVDAEASTEEVGGSKRGKKAEKAPTESAEEETPTASASEEQPVEELPAAAEEASAEQPTKEKKDEEEEEEKATEVL